jgi:hypothetical protein
LFVDNLSRRSFFCFQIETREVEATIIFPWKLKKEIFYLFRFKEKQQKSEANKTRDEAKAKQNKKCEAKNAEKPVWKQSERFEAK